MTDKVPIKLPTTRELLEAGTHYGHSSRRWHPGVSPFVYTKIRGVYIFDLEETRRRLGEACQFLYEVARGGGTILFVGLKKLLEDTIREEAERCGAKYVSGRWLGGLLTNFSEVSKNVARLEELEQALSGGKFDHYTKKEQLEISREVARLEKLVGGIRGLSSLPDAIFLSSAKRARTAVREANYLGIPIVAVVDSNTDPSLIDYPIPGNDDSLKSLSVLVGAVADAVAAGYGKKGARKESSGGESGRVAGSGKRRTIADLGLSGRARAALEKAGIGNLDSLKELSRERLLEIKGIGEKTAEEIEHLVQRL